MCIFICCHCHIINRKLKSCALLAQKHGLPVKCNSLICNAVVETGLCKDVSDFIH